MKIFKPTRPRFFKIAASFIFLVTTGFFAFSQTPFKATTLEVRNERAINSKALEFSPAFFEDGIVFISTNPMGSEKIEDKRINFSAMTLLRARRDSSGQLSKPSLFAKDLTSTYHEGPVSFDQTTEQLLFTRNVLLDGKEVYDKNGVLHTRIYLCTKSKGKWGEPFALPFNNNEFDDFHPTIDVSGNKLYFASNRPGGMGGLDLYVSFRENNVWGEPVNLGTNVNTPGDEAFPYIHSDNTLYFASKGHNGSGGFDLFYTVQNEGAWLRPFNLGTPFNTSGDDFGLIVDLDKRNGYFSSNGTATGEGLDDILSFHTENGNLDDYLGQDGKIMFDDLDLIVDVLDKESKAPLPNSIVKIFDLQQDRVLGRDSAGNLIKLLTTDGQTVMKTVPPDPGIAGITNKKGRFSSDIKPAEYAVEVSHEGYQTEQIACRVSPVSHHLIVPLRKTEGVRWNTIITDLNTNQPMNDATVVVTNPKTNKKDTLRTDPNGMVDHYLPSGENFQVDVFRDGKLVSSRPMDTKKNLPIGVDDGGSIIRDGAIIELTNIYYNFNDDALRPDATQDLDATVLLMKQYPELKIELGSHTDCRGTDEYNIDLSTRRSASAVNYLIKKGIAANRLEAAGYGEQKLKNHCTDGMECPEKEHARNRRTELKVLSGADGASVKYLEGSLGLEKTKTWQGFSTTSSDGFSGAELGPGKPIFNVIAGSFMMESGAERQLTALQQAGYGDAFIKKFGKSPFFSVVAKQCGSVDEASVLMRKLANKDGFPAFIMPVVR